MEKHELNGKVFDQRLSSFTIGEKYFIVKYSILYFDYFNPKSHLRLWMENRERSMVAHFDRPIQIMKNIEIYLMTKRKFLTDVLTIVIKYAS